MRVHPGSIVATPDGRLNYVPDLGPAIVAATGCPHYITQAQAELFGDGDPTMCRRCFITGPPALYGQYGKSGPTKRVRTTKSDPAGKGYLRRRNTKACTAADCTWAAAGEHAHTVEMITEGDADMLRAGGTEPIMGGDVAMSAFNRALDR